MPRINRTTTAFDINGGIYAATFRHTHFDPPVEVMNSDHKPGPKVCHITTCILSTPLGEKFEGEARCSSKDTYQWKRGLKLAFMRAVDAMPLVGRDLRGAMMAGFFGEMRVIEHRGNNVS